MLSLQSFPAVLPPLVILLLVILPSTTYALFSDEAGQNDFLIQTAGHGNDGEGVSHAYLSSSSSAKILTTFSKGGCYITGRDVENGAVQWRRDICSIGNTSGDNSGSTAMYGEEAEGLIHTLDHVGTVRSWNDTDGSLIKSSSNGSTKEFKQKSNTHMTCYNRKIELDEEQNLILTEGNTKTPLLGWSLDTEEELKYVLFVQCAKDTMKVIFTTRSGETNLLQIDMGGKTVVQKWMAEEALDGISSAIFLDMAHNPATAIVDDEDDEEERIIDSLSFTSRVNSQIDSLKHFVSGGYKDMFLQIATSQSTNGDSPSSVKDYAFGRAKVAVMLSNSFSKVIGLDTASNGKTAWTLNLDFNAQWHKIIHGASTGKSSVFGHGYHHPHSHEILILSHKNDEEVEWQCVDGLRGRVISKANVPISSPVTQILSIHANSHSGGGCRQNAMLVHDDGSVSVVPSTPQSMTEASKAISIGLFTHTVERESGVFRSMKITPSPSQDSFARTMTIGETLFDLSMEKIINIAYPQRNEVVQSPSTILGDDALLLKYLNPHLCVIVTEATPDLVAELEDEEEKGHDSFYKALESVDQGKGKKKPVGANKPGELVPPVQAKAPATIPTLFINVVDTVSGQILYRASHNHAQPDEITEGITNVPVVISENWIVYAFPNGKTRRTDVGVLTLHEGMIDKHGITAFTSPEQQLTFSSLASPKPIVLAKTFSVAKPVSAIGVTNTKGGISSKNILLATGVGGQIVRVDRRLLDPRRPSGEPKLTEKKEGLMQYTPLLPISPMMVPSYSNTVLSATSIISTAANLESQTLTLAYGGPDIFFTRFAPSKGFDSLPENFNKLLLLLVLLVLFIALVKTKSMGDKKAVKFGWS